MAKQFQYDVFLSHNSKDKPKVLRLAERLRSEGLEVWLDKWAVSAGDIISLKVDEGLEQSRVLLLCISTNALASDWVALERSTAIHRDPGNRDRRFIPLLLEDCELPDTLKRYKYVDYREETEESFQEVLKACVTQIEEEQTVGEIGVNTTLNPRGKHNARKKVQKKIAAISAISVSIVAIVLFAFDVFKPNKHKPEVSRSDSLFVTGIIRQLNKNNGIPHAWITTNLTPGDTVVATKDGTFEFTVKGEPGQSIRIYASANGYDTSDLYYTLPKAIAIELKKLNK